MMTDELRFSEVIDIVLARKWLVLAVIVIAMAGGVFSVVTEVPVYRSTVVVIPAKPLGGSEQRTRGSQLFGLVGLGSLGNASSTVDLQESLAVLNSRKFSADFITSNSLLPVLFADLWDAEAGDWFSEVSNPPSLNDAVRKLERSVRFVEVDEAKGIVQVHVEWIDRFLAAEWANSLVAHLNGNLRARAKNDAADAEKFLYAELAKTNNIEVEKSIYQLIESNVQRVMYANVMEEYALKVIDPAVAVDPERKENISRNLKLALSLMLGAMLGIFTALIAESFSGRRNGSANDGN